MSVSIVGPRLYAESSAVLTWLLGQQGGDDILQYLQAASEISTSELTLVECDRAIHRRLFLEDISSTRANELRMSVRQFAVSWNMIGITPDVLSRARGTFPEEPIRALDAIHIATALQARAYAPDLVVMSFDDRIRRVGASLGFQLLPA